MEVSGLDGGWRHAPTGADVAQLALLLNQGNSLAF